MLVGTSPGLKKLQRVEANATTRAQATYQVQHAQMASGMGTKLARTVADHALLYVRVLALLLKSFLN